MKKFLAVFAAAGLLWFGGAYAQEHFYEVPVLMYHLVESTAKESSLYVHPDNFERQMEYLKLHRYRVIPLSQLLDEIKGGKPLAPNTVAITLDDGTLDNFRNAFPVLRKMGFPATIFMITDHIGRPGWLSSEDLKILDESGIAIGSHTVHHAFLPKLGPEEVRRELVESKKTLEGLLGHPVTLFSYPAGGVTPAVRQAVLDAGYVGAVTTNYGKERHDPFSLHRVKIGDSAWNLFNFWLKTSGFYRTGKKTVEYTASEGH